MNKALIILNLCEGVICPNSIWCGFSPHKTIENIIGLSTTNDYDVCYIINKNGQESRYLPPHLVSISSDTARLFYYEERIKCKFKGFIEKNIMGLNQHLSELIRNHNFDEITLTGWNCSTDIVPVALDLMDLRENIVIHRECVDDIEISRKEKSLEYLGYLGVPII